MGKVAGEEFWRHRKLHSWLESAWHVRELMEGQRDWSLMGVHLTSLSCKGLNNSPGSPQHRPWHRVEIQCMETTSIVMYCYVAV